MEKKIPPIIWALIIGVPILITLPVLLGYTASSPPTQLFMGFDFIDDFHYYGNYIHSYQQNPLDLFVENRATTEPQDGRFFFPYFWVMGLFSTLIGIPLAFALIRLITAALLLLVLWEILGYFFAESTWRKTAFVLAALGAGFGWITKVGSLLIPSLGNLYSTDLTYSLGYTLFGYLSFPLSIAGEALFLFAFLQLLRFHEDQKPRHVLLFACSIVGIFFVHPISAITFFPVFILDNMTFNFMR